MKSSIAVNITYTEPKFAGDYGMLAIENADSFYLPEIVKIIEDCGCEPILNDHLINVFGYSSELTLIHQEIMGIFARISHLENCLAQA